MQNLFQILSGIFIVSILLFLLPSPIFGIVFEDGMIIKNPTPEPMDEFGFSIAYSGENILVGAGGNHHYLLNPKVQDRGAVYLYDENGKLQMKFLNPTPTSIPERNELYGHIVNILENNVLITARSDDEAGWRAGAAYLFDMTTCDEDLSNNGILDDNVCEMPLFSITNPERPREIDEFGVSSVISEKYMLIGIPLGKPIEKYGGGAYLFDVTTGDLLQTFQNPTPKYDDQFGHWVSISDNNVLIGARNDDIDATDAGAAYLFDAVTGDLLQTFQNPTPEIGDQFGSSVAISGNNVLIAARNDNTDATDAGAVYLFDAVTGDLLQTFQNPTPEIGDHFGFSLAVSGNNVLIGAIGDGAGEEYLYFFKTGSEAGAAHLFDMTTGDLLQTFQKNTPVTGDQFGFSVAISGNNVLIGAIGDDAGADDAGAVYLFLENTEGTCGDGTELVNGICRVNEPTPEPEITEIKEEPKFCFLWWCWY